MNLNIPSEMEAAMQQPIPRLRNPNASTLSALSYTRPCEPGDWLAEFGMVRQHTALGVPAPSKLPFNDQALDSARHPVSIEDEADECISARSPALASGRGCAADAMSSTAGRPKNLLRA